MGRNNGRPKDKGYGLRHDLRRDWATLKTLRGKALLVQLWEYYRYFFLAVLCVILAAVVAVHTLWEGRQPRRLWVCAVLNDEISCRRWFEAAEQELAADGKEGMLSLNEDQVFDYSNAYYYVQEMQVMTAISAGQMDVAVCGEDLYRYLLALNVCLPLDTLFPEDWLVYGTANLKEDETGQIDPADGVSGYFALDLTGTAFAETYNQSGRPLYAVIVADTAHLEDAVFLLRRLAETPM